jgi:3'-5' exoribonuclease
MVKTASAICDIYEKLDRELLICGAALHDIGKIWEYKTSAAGEAEFTPSGVLFGHLYLGASLIKQYTEGGSYNTDRVQQLTHMLLSHHGTREFGAVVCPATAEAFALYYIDNLDAKLYVCEDACEILEPGTITDKKPFGLDNRLYRPKEL